MPQLPPRIMNFKSRCLFIAKWFLLLSIGLNIPALVTSASVTKQNQAFGSLKPDFKTVFSELYNILALDSLGLSREAFSEAVTGYLNLQRRGIIQNTGVLSIVDFSIPSFKKRLFVLDLVNEKLLFNTLVAHGRNSGQILATRFSNRSRSFQSSLGFYLTGETYQGQNGYSLRLVGMEQGINDNAYRRGIIVHAASYVNDDISRKYGRLGRSEGCPAIPADIHRVVIEAIKDGSCFFIYGKDKRYAGRSKLLAKQSIS